VGEHYLDTVGVASSILVEPTICKAGRESDPAFFSPNEARMKPENQINPKAVQKKMKIASDLFEMAMKIKSHQLRKKFPEATDQEIRAKVIELIERGSR
jgi:hypothetical protein